MKFFKELKTTINNILANTSEILKLLKDLSKPKSESAYLVVARHSLGSIDLSDITDPDGLSEGDYGEHIANIFGVYSAVEQELRWIMKLQHDFWYTQGENWEQTLFGRGTTNGIQLILDRFELLRNKVLEKNKKKEEPDLGSREDILARLQVGSESELEIPESEKDK